MSSGKLETLFSVKVGETGCKALRKDVSALLTSKISFFLFNLTFNETSTEISWFFQGPSTKGILSEDPNVESDHQWKHIVNNEQGEFQWKKINWCSDWIRPSESFAIHLFDILSPRYCLNKFQSMSACLYRLLCNYGTYSMPKNALTWCENDKLVQRS